MRVIPEYVLAMMSLTCENLTEAEIDLSYEHIDSITVGTALLETKQEDLLQKITGDCRKQKKHISLII